MAEIAKLEELRKRVNKIRILTLRLVNEQLSGEYHSSFKGQGIEFDEVRPYEPGDDVRSIDWNVTARMGRPYIKIFEEERELQIFLITDSSLSMQLETNSGCRTKYASAAETAALVASAAEINACPAGAVFFDGAIHFSCEPSLGKETTMQILNHLDRLPATPTPGSVLPNAISAAAKVLRKRSLVFILSDFRCGGWEKPLISLAQKNDVIAINIHDASDEELPSLGTVTFKDMESGLNMSLPSSSPVFKKEWRSYNEMNQNRWQDFCIKHGVMPVVLDTRTEPVQVLNQIFARKAKAR